MTQNASKSCIKIFHRRNKTPFVHLNYTALSTLRLHLSAKLTKYSFFGSYRRIARPKFSTRYRSCVHNPTSRPNEQFANTLHTVSFLQSCPHIHRSRRDRRPRRSANSPPHLQIIHIRRSVLPDAPLSPQTDTLRFFVHRQSSNCPTEHRGRCSLRRQKRYHAAM